MKARGRPPTDRMEMHRIKLWATSVCFAARRPPNQLEGILGNDGVWEGLWSRYARGLVRPTKERAQRIDAILPGTLRILSCPLFSLLENRPYSWREWDRAAAWPKKLFRDALVPGYVRGVRLRLRQDYFYEEVIDCALRATQEPNLGVDGLVTLLLMMRECELQQDEPGYFLLCSAWCYAEIRRRSNPILSVLLLRIFKFPIDLKYMLRLRHVATLDYWNKQRDVFYLRFKASAKETRESYDLFRLFQELMLPGQAVHDLLKDHFFEEGDDDFDIEDDESGDY